MTSPVAREFNAQAVRHLRDDLLPRLLRGLDALSDNEIWWRPNESSNSAGNLILHLCGNVRQWIVAGVGETADIRERDLEFSERGPVPRETLVQQLTATVDEAAAVIETLDDDRLLAKRRIQIYDVGVLQAVFHVVEHFSYHTGQILYIAKLLKDRDLGFYSDLDAKKKRF